jgi:DNA anti-recombination protein RmuC
MQEALGKLENQEKCLENSLERRRNSIAKIIGKMKNSADAVAKREQKKQDGVENFKKIQNAELEAMINSAAGPVTPTETSRSMVERGQKRYGSGN